MDFKNNLLEVIHQSKTHFTPYQLLSPHLNELPWNRPIYIFALGKAAYQMTEAVLTYTKHEPFIRIMGGLIITRYGNAQGQSSKFTIIESSHPIPDENSFKAGDAAIDFLQGLKEDDILLVLLSGGGSSLMEKPDKNVSRDDIIAKTKELLNSGSDIETLNSERKKLSAIKGGKLLQYTKPKSIFIYAMSDVPGNKPKNIASNPFLPEAEKSDDNISTESFRRFDNLAARKTSLHNKAIVYKIIADNRSFCDVVKGTTLEFVKTLQHDRVHLVSTDLTGEASKAGKEISALASFIHKQRGKGFSAFRTPCLLIFGGETAVTVKGNGIGGRCTELVLAAVDGLSEVPNCILLAYATDGQDGFCNAAGAIIDSNTKKDLLEHGIEPKSYLEDNDSYTALKVVNAIIPSETTGLCVNDVVLMYVH